jgi:RimJ/RimL family protein N-acetyltransferase
MHLDLGELSIRSWRVGDEDDLRANADDPRVAAQLRDRFPHPYTANDAREWVAMNVGYPETLSFAIALNDRVIGGIGAERGYDIARRSAEVGYWLGVRWHGRGYATRALGAFSAELLREGEFVRLWAGVLDGNDASARVLQKCGFEREALLRAAAYKSGRFVDQHVYALVRLPV